MSAESGPGGEDESLSADLSLAVGNIKLEEPAADAAPTKARDSEKTEKSKIDILLKATGNAPIMKIKKWSVEAEKPISCITEHVKKYLKLEPEERVFLYVNQTFAPSPDHLVRNLYECFGTDGRLVLHYCKTQAWG